MDGSLSLVPLSCEQLASALQTYSRDLLLVDVRPSGQYCSSHIHSAENLNFSNILLRRLLKGVVKLEAMLTSPELIERVCRRRHATQLVLCDFGSAPSSIRPELNKHAEVFVNCLKEKDAKDGMRHQYIVQYVDGGFQAFSQRFPDLCEQTMDTGSAPVHISVSASLPISLTAGKRKLQLQSAPLDDSDRFGPPVELLPHLILGCARDSSDLATLERLGVTAVLNVSHNCPSLFTSQFEYMEIRVPDTYQADLLSRLDDAFAFIDGIKARGGRVLIHCHAGISRSATVCMAYIMKSLGYNLRSAYDYVKNRRSCVSPNLHFMGQLLEYEKRLGHHTCTSIGMEQDSFKSALSCVKEEVETPPPNLWGGKEKRRAISTPSSLDLYSPPYGTAPSSHRSKLSLLTPLPIKENSTSLPNTPITHFRNSHTQIGFPAHDHCSKSRSLQSLTLPSPCRMAAKNSSLPHHRPGPITESL